MSLSGEPALRDLVKTAFAASCTDGGRKASVDLLNSLASTLPLLSVAPMAVYIVAMVKVRRAQETRVTEWIFGHSWTDLTVLRATLTSDIEDDRRFRDSVWKVVVAAVGQGRLVNFAS